MSKIKWGRTSRKLLIVACMLVLVCVSGVAIWAATQQDVGITGHMSFRASGVNAKVYYDFYHQTGETKTTINTTFGNNVTTGQDAGGKYFLINSRSTGDISASISDVQLELIETCLPNGTWVQSSYFGVKLTIINDGVQDIGVSFENDSNEDLDNLDFVYITNLGTGRTATSATGFTVLKADYGDDPGVATGTALTTGSVEMCGYVHNVAQAVANSEYTFPISFYATNFVAVSDNVTTITLSEDSDTVIDGDSSVINLYADSSATPFATYNFAGQDITASKATTGENEIVATNNNIGLMGNLTPSNLPVGFNMYSMYPMRTTSITVEAIIVNNTASKGIFVDFGVVSASVNGGYPAVATTGSGAVANMNNGSNNASIRTSTVKKTYTINGGLDSTFSLSLNIETIENQTASHTFTYTATSDGRGYSVKKSGTPTGALTLPTYYNNLLVTDIGRSAFSNCNGLTGSLTIPSSVTSIGTFAFNNCWRLTSITIPNSVTSIVSAFALCSGLTSITIPNSVTSIGDVTFHNCTGLTSITIPNSVTSIGRGAFSYCSGLTSVTIGSGVTSIGNEVFWYCRGLTSITVDSGNTVYKSEGNCIIQKSNNCLILGCKNSVIPNTVTSIGEYAFLGCSGLTSVTIPNSVTSIGFGAFADCTGLTSITIPNSVTIIGRYAFNECSNLTSVTFEDTTTWHLNSTTGTVIDVSTPATNATNLKSTYVDYYWYKV